jgi:LPS export ABC transporter protein LptC
LDTSRNNTIKLSLQSLICSFYSFTERIKRISLVRLVRYSASFKSLLIFSVILIYGCENDKKVLDEWTRNVVLNEEAINIETYFSQKGVMKAKLKAPLMIRVPKIDSPYVEFPKKLHVDFYNDSIVIESWLDCKYGKYYESQNKVYLKDSVVVITDKGDTLKAHDLWWDQNAKLFYTDKYAEYHGKDKTIYGGKGFEATQDLKRRTFKYPTGTIKVEDSGFPE